MRGIGLYTSILIGVVFIFFGVIYWPSIQKISKPTIPDSTLEKYDFQLAESYLKKQRPVEALQLISQYQDSIQKQSPMGKQWLKLFIEASILSKDVAQLQAIYEFNPEALDDYEKAALLLGESFILTGNEAKYAPLRKKWQGMESNKEAWFLLDVDFRLASGDYEEAIKSLQAKTLRGAFETSRLLRLGLLHASSDPIVALGYFEEAQSKDPSSTDAALYKAKLLESSGNLIGAEKTLVEGIKTNPNATYLRDHLANYYTRYEQPAEALATLKDGLALPGAHIYLTKALFLNRVVGPQDRKILAQAALEGKPSVLNQYFSELKADEFWNEDKLKNLGLAEADAEELFWLHLLHSLKAGDDDQALQMLHAYHAEPRILNPRLEHDLLQVILFRKTGDFLSGDFGWNEASSPHPLLQTIRKQKVVPSNEERNLLLSSEAYPALLLASGWQQAALSLSQADVIPESFPSWYAYELTQAIRQNQGDAQAFAFATKQVQNLPLSVLTQELEARIALSQGNVERADILYRILEANSSEAKSYLARKAFKEGNWDKARQLTVELIALYPDNKMLKENLNKIELEKATSANTSAN